MRIKIEYYFLTLALLLGGCSDQDDETPLLKVTPATLEFAYNGVAQPLVITASADWHISSPGEWCSATPAAGLAGTDTVWVSVTENSGGIGRKTTLTVNAGGENCDVAVNQNVFAPDGSVYTYLTAKKGNGVKIVVMGDGFTIADMTPRGKYEQAMEQAVEHLLDIEPFKSYRDYFSASVVRAVSNQSGISDKTEGLDTRFRVKYESATSTTMSCDTATCFRYACKAPINNKLNETLIILVANSVRYAGSTYMYTDGASIAICPMAQKQPYENFRGIVQHEAGGHGFAKLIDEYIYSPETLPQAQSDWIKANEKYGFYSNVDLTDDLTKIKWAHFIGKTDYENVGAYEGAYKYAKGIWRPESISCMDDMRPHYNAPSREAVVKRICQLAGITYNFDEFVRQDLIPVMAERMAAPRANTTLLPPPRVISGSPALSK